MTMVAFKVKTSKWVDILKEIGHFESLQQVVKATGKNYHTLRYHAILLEKVGFLYSLRVANKRRYFLTEEGRRFLSKHLSGGGESFKVKWRLHCNEFVFRILEKPAEWDRKKPQILIKLNRQVREVSLNNNTYALLDFLPVCVKVTNNEVRFYLNEIYGATPEDVERNSIKQMMDVLPTITRHLKKLGIVIQKPNFGVDATNTQHYARENDPIALSAANTGHAIDVRDRAGERRVTSDSSKCSPELEFPHPVHARDDAETYNKILQGYINGELDPFRDKKDIEQLYEHVINLQKLALAQVEAQAKSHSSFENTMEGVARWN